MTFNDGEIKHILPSWLRERDDVQAISYAIKQQIDKLQAYKAYIYGYAWVDNAPENVLDLMALELNVRYYNESYDIDLKRELIKKAIIIAMKDGTKFAVDTVIQTIYGDGEAVDWYDYNGTPNHFRIDLDSLDGFDRLGDMMAVVNAVKRKTARLDSVNIIQSAEEPLYFGEILMEALDVYLSSVDPGDREVTFLTDEGGDILATEDFGMLFTSEVFT